MAWHTSTVPGKGWVELRGVTARIRPPDAYVHIVADVKVNVDDPAWKAYSGENWQEIQKAIMARLKTAIVIRGSIQHRDRLLVRIAKDRGPGREGWLEFWGETLGVEVLDVYRWSVLKRKEPKKK